MGPCYISQVWIRVLWEMVNGACRIAANASYEATIGKISLGRYLSTGAVNVPSEAQFFPLPNFPSQPPFSELGI